MQFLRCSYYYRLSRKRKTYRFTFLKYFKTSEAVEFKTDGNVAQNPENTAN